MALEMQAQSWHNKVYSPENVDKEAKLDGGGQARCPCAVLAIGLAVIWAPRKTAN